jgi:TrkA domain protein
MPIDLSETRLPGVGTKFTLRLDRGARIAVILHNDGIRELYYFAHAQDEEPQAVITLDDDEARQLGAVIGGAYERPKIVEDLELALGELTIEWIAVPDSSPWIGKTLAESGFRAKTGVTVIAILREPEPVSGAQPGDVIQRGDTLVTVGKAGQYTRFRQLLASGTVEESSSTSSVRTSGAG